MQSSSTENNLSHVFQRFPRHASSVLRISGVEYEKVVEFLNVLFLIRKKNSHCDFLGSHGEWCQVGATLSRYPDRYPGLGKSRIRSSLI
ncbi:hypothetical protein Y032_0003g1236 [Ancylostoma ceylanicum]|uniref:Uncharacterized protein n=1 Tax=Ancylostoma ceylanicum TaxID=53326 RepID=A0A016VVZ4_9BILA|nr:hypothetical protein Y032_0003g1236 [Ancylostoma ceylanicum]